MTKDEAEGVIVNMLLEEEPLTLELLQQLKLLINKSTVVADCDDDCEHFECAYVVACERQAAEDVALARTALPRLIDELEASWEREAALKTAPMIPTELTCPECFTVHVDQDEWASTRIHRKHLCLACGFVWEPYLVPTVGVDFHKDCRSKEAALEKECAIVSNELHSVIARRDELLKLVSRLSREVPYTSEIDGLHSANAALIAEVGTLRAKVLEDSHEITELKAALKVLRAASKDCKNGRE